MDGPPAVPASHRDRNGGGAIASPGDQRDRGRHPHQPRSGAAAGGAGLARGREVLVSRGELVEIGGSFRIPDIMAESGAILVEVGRTNRTRLKDYEKAITGRTALLLKVHRSNFSISGFTEEVSAATLSDLGERRGVPGRGGLGPRG